MLLSPVVPQEEVGVWVCVRACVCACYTVTHHIFHQSIRQFCMLFVWYITMAFGGHGIEHEKELYVGS